MKYSKDHVWIKNEEDTIRIGLSEYAQEELGELTFIEYPELGTHFEANDVICSIDSLKAASDVYAPVAGTVIELNMALTESGAASKVNSDPLGEGWLAVIRPDSISDLKKLLSETAYLDYIKE